MNPLDQLSYEMLVFLEESTYDKEDWQGFTGHYFYTAIKEALQRKINKYREMNSVGFIYCPERLK